MKKFALVILLIALFASCAYSESRITLAELRGTVGVQMEEFVRNVKNSGIT